MSTQAPTDKTFLQVMERTGFYRAGKPTSGVFDAASLRTPANGFADKAAKYSAVVAENKLGATAIYELSGSPCIYFKEFEAQPSAHQLEKLHKTAWNQGLAPLMWVFTPTQICIYNNFAKPQLKGKYTGNNKPELEVFQRTEEDLRRLNDFAGRVQFESGRFWQQEAAQRINRDNRVDNSLLSDLQFAEEALLKINVNVEPELKSLVAHSLLGRSIFAAYLKDRGIVSADFLQKSFGHEEVADILGNKTSAYKFFRWIRATFNGDLFPLRHETANKQSVQEEDIVQATHLEIIKSLLVGSGNEAGQGRLWRYEFNVIPIELISSIYEMFARSNNPGKAKQQSMHYTPFNLVDLVLSDICPRLPNKAKIADLSCGSGVFLVESLRRLVARRAAEGENISREMVRDTLYNQIFGVDISPEAIQIAAFSLYLTALELDDAPQPPEALKFEHLRGRNLFVADVFNEQAYTDSAFALSHILRHRETNGQYCFPISFFRKCKDTDFSRHEPFLSKKLDAIVGNPPWKQEPVGGSGRQYCKRHRDQPIAENYLSQAFLWRVGDFVSEKTRIGLILHASPFFSHTKEAYAAKSALLQRFKPDTLVNFSELHQQKLFPNAVAPALVYIGTGQQANDKDTCAYISVEWSGAFRKSGILEIGPENVKRLPVHRAATDPDMLKVAAWGNARDMALIERLRDNRNSKALGTLLDEWNWPEPALGVQESKKGKWTLSNDLPKRYLPADKMPAFLLDVKQLHNRAETLRVHYKPSRLEIYRGPIILAVRGISQKGFYAAIAEDDLIYNNEYIGLPATGINARYRYLLNGILNSQLAEYFLFITSSSWGIERKLVGPIDLLRLPIPNFDKADNTLLEQIQVPERKIAVHGVSQLLQQQLNSAVFDLYGLNDNERILVEDTLNLTIDRQMKRAASHANARPNGGELKAYAERFLSVVQPFFRALNTHNVIAEVFNVGSAPLVVVKFRIVPLVDKHVSIKTVLQQDLASVLESIARELPHPIAERLYSRRNLRIYNDNDIYMVKPAEKRFWSRSSGLNDADLFLSDSMGVENAAR